MCIAAEFIKTKIYNQIVNQPMTKENVHIHDVIIFSYKKKKNEFLSFKTKWMELEAIKFIETNWS